MSICGPCLTRTATDAAQHKAARDNALSSMAAGGACYFFSGLMLGMPGGQFLMLAIGCIGFAVGVVALRRRGSAPFKDVVLPAVIGLVANVAVIVVAVLLALGWLVFKKA